MTFQEVKDAVLLALRRVPGCDGPAYHDAALAADYDALIAASQPFLSYLWRAGILTEIMLDEVDTLVLQAHGIYYKLTATITDPPTLPYNYFDSYEIWILFGSDITVAFISDKKYKVNVIQANAQITASENCYIDLTLYRATGSFTMNDNAICFCDIQNISSENFTINQNDFTYLQIMSRSYTILALNILDAAYTNLRSFGKAITNTNILEDQTILTTEIHEMSTINYGAPV